MTRPTLNRAAIMVACLVMLTAAALGFAGAAQRTPEPPSPGVKVVASEFGSNFTPLGVGKSVVVELSRDVKDVLVADPKIANAVIRTARRAYLIGVSVGQTNIYFFDAEGRQLAGFDIAVTKDLNGMRGVLRQMFPEGNVRVEAIADGVMLSGVVTRPVEAQQAFDLAARLAGDATKVVNNITVRARDQVMLKVTVAEVDRQVIKQLGINLSGTGAVGAATVNFNNTNTFSVNGGPLSGSSIAGTYKNVTANLQAMERAGVTRILAEPNLTAISGEKASFLVGGQFPYLHRAARAKLAGGSAPDLPGPDRFQELRREHDVHAGGAVGRSHQPEGADGGLKPRPRKFSDGGGNHRSRPGRAARRDDGGNSLRWLACHGRHAPGTDETADQRPSRADGGAYSRRTFQKPRLPQ